MKAKNQVAKPMPSAAESASVEKARAFASSAMSMQPSPKTTLDDAI
ncbi:MAG: hypothetical protein IPM54_33685 [Polyangiaceae bacterium]|nr:hypothetical protein [Polyangiaceae bacterium]